MRLVKIGRLPVVAASLWVSASLPAVASETAFAGVTPTAQSEAETIAIPFNPPLDREMRFRITTTKPRGNGQATASIEQSLRVSKASDGFILTVTPLRMSKPGGPVLEVAKAGNALPPALRPFLTPYSYDLDADGAVLRIRDWEKIKADMLAAEQGMAEMMEPDPKKRGDAKAIAHAVLGMYANLTAEQAPSHLAKQWTAVLGNAGLELPEDEAHVVETEIETGMLVEPVPAKATLTLLRGEKEGSIRLVQQTELDQAAASAAIEHFMMRLADTPLSHAKGRERLKEAPAKLRGMSIADRIEITFDASTGLPINGLLTRQMTLPDGTKAVQTDLIEAID